MALINLSLIRDQEVLTSAIAHEASFDPQSANAVATTTLQLHSASSSQLLKDFSPSKLTVVAPAAASESSSEKCLDFLSKLVASAERAAVSLMCSSILVGQGSESDYLGDVGVLLGSGGNFAKGNEQAVLKTLSLDLWAGLNTTPARLEGPDLVPSLIAKASDSPETREFKGLLQQLEDRYCFRVNKASISSPGSVVVFMLIGRYGSDWCGLCGMGTWAG